MEHSTTVRCQFEAAHHVPDSSICGWNHGHQWTIEVTVTGGLDPKKVLVVDHGDFYDALENLVAEIRGRGDINDMLPGVVTTPEGLALYVRERLILDWPRITEIRVHMGSRVTAILKSEIR